MSEPRDAARQLTPDELELLAAYIDNQLSAEDRAAAERILAHSWRAREVFAAVAGAEDAEEEAPPPAADEAGRRWPRWTVVPPIAAAAVLALVFLTNGEPAGRPDQTPAPGPVANTTTILVQRVAAVVSDPVADSTILRGGGRARQVASFAARWFDARLLLEVVGDSAARAALQQLKLDVDSLPDFEAFATSLEGIEEGDGVPSNLLRGAEAALRGQDSSAYDAGVLVGAIRQATLAGDPNLVGELTEMANPGVRSLDGFEDLRAAGERLSGDTATQREVLRAASEFLARIGR